MKASDVIADFLEQNSIDTVFGIIGSANSYIFDSIDKKGYTRIIYVHHEQAAVMAAGAYYRASGRMSAALVTAGPGAINSLTGVVSNWADSIPTIIISGQESTQYLKEHSDLRMIGTQGFEACEMVKDVTKYSNVVKESKDILYELEKCLHIASSGRPGPTWLDIPFDIQSKEIEEELTIFEPEQIQYGDAEIEQIISMINKSERPVIMGGHGVRLSGSKKIFRELVNQLKIPVLLSWSGVDLLEEDNSFNFGRAGLYGQRRANFVIQNCDLLIVLGSRLALPQTGYNINNFAPSAKIIMINNDSNELKKHEQRYDLKIHQDCKQVIELLQVKEIDSYKKEWVDQCNSYKEKFPTVEKHHKETNIEHTNSYVFMDEISNHLKSDHVIVCGMGTPMPSSHQALRLKEDQIMFTSNGLGEMGVGLPFAVGAALSQPDRDIVCFMSDGSMMMNLQELQTIINYGLPVKIVLFNNDGYLFIKHTQKMLFKGHYVGVNKDTGITLPNYEKVANAFGYKYFRDRACDIEEFLNCEGAAIYEVFMHPDQELSPKVKGVALEDGSIFPPPIEEMSPLLDLKTMKENMIIGMNEDSKFIDRENK